MLKLVLCVLLVLLALTQYRLWVGEGSLAQVVRLKQEIKVQRQQNEALMEKNRVLRAEVHKLKNGYETIEEKARTDMGLIKKGETFYMFVEEEGAQVNE